MDFRERFSNLNDNQKAAVEQIYGPLLIIADNTLHIVINGLAIWWFA